MTHYSLLQEELDSNLVTQWTSAQTFSVPADVQTAFNADFRFVEEDLGRNVVGLRIPQAGALHAIKSYWSTGRIEPATVVMPTGTGKTDVMIATMACSQLSPLLVLVPSVALRRQISNQFQTYGVLKMCGVLPAELAGPIVGIVQAGFPDVASVGRFVDRCNVLVATPQALAASGPTVRNALMDRIAALFVDEAHHLAAETWSSVRSQVTGKRIIQFTATPFREDKKSIGGKIIYDFPLREAQKLGYFKRINYHAVTNFRSQDSAIAEKAVELLRADLTAGYDHLLMARVKSVRRAEEVLDIYQSLSPDLNPICIHSGLSEERRTDGEQALRGRTSRVVICVDMLGEGFDLPYLKIAAIHDAHKSLGITLQFIGRFTRSSGLGIHDASVVVSRPRGKFDDRIRALFLENADWNLLVADLSEGAITSEVRTREFGEGFSVNPLDISFDGVSPKMSTVVYRTRQGDWNPDKVTDIYASGELATYPYSINETEKTLWFVTVRRLPVEWGLSSNLEETEYELFIIHFDSINRLLFINSSRNDGFHKSLAQAIGGDDVELISGLDVFKAYSNMAHAIPTNIGTKDVLGHHRSHTMHSGSNVTEGLQAADMQTKTQTNLFAKGFECGSRSTIGVSLRGRIWSFAPAPTILHWVDWCRLLGPKLIDPNANVDEILKKFIRPEPARVRPNLVALALKWPEDWICNVSEGIRVIIDGREHPLIDADLVIREYNDSGPVLAGLRTEAVTVPFDIEILDGQMRFTSTAVDPEIRGSRGVSTFLQYMNRHGANVIFEREVVVDERGLLLKIVRNLDPYDRGLANVETWTGVNVRKESQTQHRFQDSIQYYMIEKVLEMSDWDLVIDDDSAGEIADIVAIRMRGTQLEILLVHCKYSTSDDAGARLPDLYEVCGQAIRSADWRHHVYEMMANLVRRERNRQHDHGYSGLVVGSDESMLSLWDRIHTASPITFTVAIAQPGLSIGKAEDDHLVLIATSAAHVRDAALGDFQLFCSA